MITQPWELPGSDNLFYFDENDSNTFVEQILTADKEQVFTKIKKVWCKPASKEINTVVAPGGFEPQPLIRSQVLCPVELQAHKY